jgi:hypothetical protein
MWRLLGLLAVLMGIALGTWFLDGGPGRLLRGRAPAPGSVRVTDSLGLELPERAAHAAWQWAPIAGIAPVRALAVIVVALTSLLAASRWRARRRRSYVRLELAPHRTDYAQRPPSCAPCRPVRASASCGLHATRAVRTLPATTTSGRAISTFRSTEPRRTASQTTCEREVASGSMAASSGESGRRPMLRNGRR